MKAVLRILACALASTAASAQNPPPPPPPPPEVTRVVEFANAVTGRSVWLSDPAEIAIVESGGAGPGWSRNGYFFDSSSQYDDERVDVCRFYAPSSNSHFFTANPRECAELRAAGSGWLYEKVAFRAHPERPWGCGVRAVYRLYNNRWMHNDSAHRFTSDRALRKRLIEQGWVDEGVAFCTDGSGREIDRSWYAESRDQAPRADCEDPGSNLGTCVMSRGLPALAHSMPSPANADFLTGLRGWEPRLYTSQPTHDTAAVLASSFVQVPANAFGSAFGFRLVGSNRIGGELATLGLVHQFPTAPPSSFVLADERVFPWSDGRERDLGLSFTLRAYLSYPTAPETDPAQAYGLALLRFQDRTSGRALMVTLQAFGRSAPGSGVLRDIHTNQPIVTTFFGENPAFGWSDHSSYARCSEAVAQPRCFLDYLRFGGPVYAFRLARADFAKVLEMARTVDGALSGDPADYMVSSFQFRGETYRDASVGFSVFGLGLTLSK